VTWIPSTTLELRAIATTALAERDEYSRGLLCLQLTSEELERSYPSSVQIRRGNEASNWSSRRRSPNSAGAGAHNESPRRTRP